MNMDGPGGDCGSEGGHGDCGHGGDGHGDHGGHGNHDGASHSGMQNADGDFDGANDGDYDVYHGDDFEYADIPGENHSTHGTDFDYGAEFPGDQICDDATGVDYYVDGHYHSGSGRFLDSYFYGGRLHSGVYLGNNTTRIGRLVNASYTHGYTVYPFGSILAPLAGELYRASLRARANTDSSRSSPEYDDDQIKVILEAADRAKNAPDRNYYGAHVAHGFIDVHETLETLATNAGLSRVAVSATSKFVQIEPVISDKGVSDWNRFVPPYSREETPLGYYPGARGLTYFTQQCWTSPSPKPANFWAGVLQACDCTPASQIEIRIVTWYFADVDDYETRIDMRVTQGQNFTADQTAAAKLCNDMLALLKGVKPTYSAQAKRCKISAGNYLI
jgi:hypothetical protein